MNNLSDRLREVMAELNLGNNKSLADFCEVSEGLVTQWFSGQTKLGPKPLKAFSRTSFSLDWLTTGKLPKYRVATEPVAAQKASGESSTPQIGRSARLLIKGIIDAEAGAKSGDLLMDDNVTLYKILNTAQKLSGYKKTLALSLIQSLAETPDEQEIAAINAQAREIEAIDKQVRAKRPMPVSDKARPRLSK